MNDQINVAAAKLQSSITCASVTAAVRDIWHPYMFAISVPNMYPSSAYATFVPSAGGVLWAELRRELRRLGAPPNGTLG